MPQFLLGNAGMPRRYFMYPARVPVRSTCCRPPGPASWRSGLFLNLVYLVYALFRGPRAGRNPWRSRCHEWATPSPPPKHNFEDPPAFRRGPYDYHLPDPAGEEGA